MSFFNPNHYKNLHDDSAMIQAAVDEAAKCGETVVIPRLNERTGEYSWNVARAIKLYSGSVICLDNCLIRQADESFENIFINSNNNTPLGCTREGRQYDIKIYGVGNAVLDGGKHNGVTENNYKELGRDIYFNSMFNFVNVERISIENIRIVHQRYWSMMFHYCSHGRISNIDYYAPHLSPNQDGIDLRTGCSHFIIENITGCTGDDTVALTCLRSKYDEPLKNAGLDDGIHHVIIRNICSQTPCSLVRLLNHGGKLIHDIIIENVMEYNEKDESHGGEDYQPLDELSNKFVNGACVRIGENFYFREYPKAKVDETYNVTVRNIKGRWRTGVRVSCALSDSTIENVQVGGVGGTAVYFGEGVVKNICVSEIGYPLSHCPRATDDNRRENYFNQIHDATVNPDRKLCAIYFKETEAENIIVRNVFASKNLTSVFGGNGSVTMSAEGIVREDKSVPLFDSDLTVKKMECDSF